MLESVVQLERKGGNFWVCEQGVISVVTGIPRHVPPGKGEDLQCSVVLLLWEQQIDVFHWSEAGLGVADGQTWSLQDDGLQPGVRQWLHSAGHGAGKEEQCFHAVRVKDGRQSRSGRTEGVECIGCVKGSPQKRGDAMVDRQFRRSLHVCALANGGSQLFGSRFATTRFPQDQRRLLVTLAVPWFRSAQDPTDAASGAFRIGSSRRGRNPLRDAILKSCRLSAKDY
jgi:hypothetical protein